MRQVIYVDVLVFLNTTVTFLLLLTVRLIVAAPTKTARLAAASFAGGMSSLILLAPRLSVLTVTLFKLASGMLIVRIAFPSGGKKLLRCFCAFMGASYGFGGLLYALRYTLGEALTVHNGYGYFEFSAASLILITGALYAALRLLSRFVLRKSQSDHLYGLKLYLGERSVCVKALMDSGHTVRDVYTGRPVVILNVSFAEALAGACPARSAAGEPVMRSSFGVPLRSIPVFTLGGQRFLTAFSVDGALVNDGAAEKECKRVTVAVTDDPLGGETYQALMNEDIL